MKAVTDIAPQTLKRDPTRMGKALLAMHASQAHRLATPVLGGMGAIFMLHRVRADDGAAFAPNRLLEVTPEFLDETIRLVKSRGYKCLSLEEATRRLMAGENGERFAVFTLDDGYRDNLTEALPVFARHDVPFTVYLATDMADGTAEIWWVALERAVAAASKIRLKIGLEEIVLPTVSTAEKYRAYDKIYRVLRARPEEDLRLKVRELAQAHNVDMAALTRELAMTWDELRQLAAEPLASIEAHTAAHFALASLAPDRVRAEIARGISRHESELGRRPTHFSYPYGGPDSAGPRDFTLAGEFGFLSATTTRKGLIQPRHAQNMMRLPRLSLNGLYQDKRMLEMLLSGLPFALGKPFASLGID